MQVVIITRHGRETNVGRLPKLPILESSYSVIGTFIPVSTRQSCSSANLLSSKVQNTKNIYT